MKQSIYIDFHCPSCGEPIEKLMKGQFSTTAICINSECRQLIPFDKWLLIVSFIEEVAVTKYNIDALEIACPACDYSDHNLINDTKDNISCPNCGKQLNPLDFIHLITYF